MPVEDLGASSTLLEPHKVGNNGNNHPNVGTHVSPCLQTGNAFANGFLSMASLLDIIGEKYEFERTDAPYDSTAVRFNIPGRGNFGIIANESEPFCTNCTRLRLSSDGNLYGCLSNARSQSIAPLADLPTNLALPKLQKILLSALGDKKLAFQGEVTVMKFIGG